MNQEYVNGVASFITIGLKQKKHVNLKNGVSVLTHAKSLPYLYLIPVKKRIITIKKKEHVFCVERKKRYHQHIPLAPFAVVRVWEKG